MSIKCNDETYCPAEVYQGLFGHELLKPKIISTTTKFYSPILDYVTFLCRITPNGRPSEKNAKIFSGTEYNTAFAFDMGDDYTIEYFCQIYSSFKLNSSKSGIVIPTGFKATNFGYTYFHGNGISVNTWSMGKMTGNGSFDNDEKKYFKKVFARSYAHENNPNIKGIVMGYSYRNDGINMIPLPVFCSTLSNPTSVVNGGYCGGLLIEANLTRK